MEKIYRITIISKTRNQIGIYLELIAIDMTDTIFSRIILGCIEDYRHYFT